MKKLILLTFCLAAMEAKAPAQNSKVVTAAQVNGVYRYYKSEFRILALGHNKLKVQFSGIYITASGSPNMGDAAGEATIEVTSRPSFHLIRPVARSRLRFYPARLW